MISALWSQFEGQSIDNSFRLTQLIGVGRKRLDQELMEGYTANAGLSRRISGEFAHADSEMSRCPEDAFAAR
jgi:hypothetical protein